MKVLKHGQTRPRYFELPYTTQYGKNWEPWQAFRELESNTRDEGGRTFIADGPIVSIGASNSTRIIVSHPGFLEAAEKIDTIFLPRARREGKLLEAIDADDRPNAEDANFVFYRTMRALDVGKPTLFTYNILESCTLTEDRTLASSYQIRGVLARWTLTEATEAQVQTIVTAEEEYWEHALEFPGYVSPSEAFRAVMERKPKGTSRYAHAYWSNYVSPSRRVREKATFSLFQTCKRPWKLSGDFIFDGDGVEVFERPDDMASDDWDNIAEDVIKRLDANPAPEPEVSLPIEQVNTEKCRNAEAESVTTAADEIPF